jgi:two-component system cell cycle sensor histidine kinase/response regulator CckA
VLISSRLQGQTQRFATAPYPTNASNQTEAVLAVGEDQVTSNLTMIDSQTTRSTQPLRLILVEDSEDDARLIVRTLRQGGFDVTWRRVENAEALDSLLGECPWDLIISDHGLPHFNAPTALRLVRGRSLDLPFIIVSGTIGEEVAVAAMKAGASDYLVKGQLARLVPAVQRELGEVEQRRQRRQVEETLRQTEDQLRQAQKMEAIGQLAGGVAHDFNNLLTAILGYGELLLDEWPSDASGRADLEEILKAGARAATLTRQLLAFSRQQVLEPRVVNLNDMVSGIERLLVRVIGEDVEIVTDPAPVLGRVKVDPGQVEQVLMNLAVNARDAMPRGGRLTIRTSNCVLSDVSLLPHAEMKLGRYVLMTVSDTGTGISPDIQRRIFEPFFTTKEAGKGTGLGLSTVYGIVKQSGGYIRVDSELGRGTTFEVYLPSVEEALDTQGTGERAVARVEGSETVLLVEDERGIRELLRKALEGHGYRVLVAGDGEEALAVIQAHSGSVHLLITDVVLPRIGGIELTARLLDERPLLRVLYVSGYLNQGASQSPPVGAEFLPKPFTPAALLRKVRAILDMGDTRMSRTMTGPGPRDAA